MKIDLIVSQGRVADRVPRMIEGAALVARALEDRYGLQGRAIGTFAPPADDDWSVSLPQAETTLLGLGAAVTDSLRGGRLPVLISNTCSASIATLPAVAREHPDAVVLYIDAHGDFNTPETTGTGYLGGMVLAAACGLWDSGHGSGLRPAQAVLVGARDIDEAERDLLAQTGVRVVPPEEVTAESIRRVVGGAPVWIHIDWDVLDPTTAVPAEYVVPDGLSEAQIRTVFETIPREQLVGVELAEFNAPTDEGVSAAAVAAILAMVAPAFEDAPITSR